MYVASVHQGPGIGLALLAEPINGARGLVRWAGITLVQLGFGARS